MRKLVKFIIAVLFMPLVPIYCLVFMFLDWIFEEHTGVSEDFFKGWLRWISFNKCGQQ